MIHFDHIYCPRSTLSKSFPLFYLPKFMFPGKVGEGLYLSGFGEEMEGKYDQENLPFSESIKNIFSNKKEENKNHKHW